MREILFRARDKNGKWRLGNLQKFGFNGAFCEITAHGLTGERRSYLCASSTVEQYTGLTDKYGTKIFEGDIMQAYLDEDFPDNVTTVSVEWVVNGWYIKQGTVYDLIDEEDCINFQVVGNIHDNPELLEVDR